MTTSPLPLKARLAKLWVYFKGSQWGLALAGLGSVIAAATESAVPALMKPLLDNGFQKGELPLWMVPTTIIGLFTLRSVASFLSQYGLAWATNRGVLAMRTAMFNRLLDSQPALFTRSSASSLINTIAFEVQGGANQLVASVQTLVKDSLTLIGLLGWLLYLNWQLTLFALVLLPSAMLVMRLLSRRLRRIVIEAQRAADELAYVVEENVNAWRVVRLHGAEAQQSSRFARASARLRQMTMKSVVASSTMTPATQMLVAIALSAVITVALWQSGKGGASVGDFVSFVTAMLMLATPVKHLSDVAGSVTRGLAALERGENLIDNTAIEKNGGYDPGRARGHFEMRDVTLSYRADAAPALANVSFELQVGENVALVGPSGAGKSTLVNLLPRFIEPSSGTVWLDGHRLEEWDVQALRRQFALVSQDVVLFNDTVAANVALGETPDPERVKTALRSANLLDFALALPQGIDTPIGHNGRELSGGQRQRLAIARAIYKEATILILDEATSALDSESERLVQQALETLMKGRTSLVIAHRLSTIEKADRIIVLDGGRVVEQGSHAELQAHGGLYARLHAIQFRGA
jgi:ATP-binding cassette, subfamily B, bacterial MsbA